ncbi:MAG: GC-type dockerin domain-anchored protein [Phycisphaerales bacterium JB037]
MKHASIPAAALLSALSGGALAQPSSCAWEFFPTPSISDRLHLLYDIDGLADDDVWAVGRATKADFKTETFAIHFDGSTWTQTPTPSPSIISGWNDLWGVVVLGPDDVIALGSYNPDSGGATQSLAIRWDGSNWSQINAPFITGGSAFYDAERIGNDIWGVGGRRWGIAPPAAAGIALAARWDGSDWNEEFVPPLAELGGRSYNDFRAVHGVSADDVWGVGDAQQTGPTDPFGPRTYMVHWNGSEWSLVDFPFGNPFFSALNDVFAIAADDVYAVGYTLVGNEGTQPLIAHYDGSSWSQVNLPIFPEGSCELRAVTARSTNEVYAFGTWAEDNGSPRDLILRFDGKEWAVMPAAPDKEDEWFRTAFTLPSGTIWAGGQYLEPTYGTIALAERLACTPSDPCPADLTGSSDPNDPTFGVPDGDADGDDFFFYLDAFATTDLGTCDLTGSSDPSEPTFGSPDADCDGDDFFFYLDLFVAGCS